MPMSNRRPIPKVITSGNNDDHPPLLTVERTPVEASPLVIEIPDNDDSDASLVVLMRYMGCSTRTQHGRSYSFDSYAESEPLFSDEIYGYSTSEEDIKPCWTMKNNEVGMKISIRNVILACCSPASLIMYAEEIESPTKAAACTEKKKAKKTYLAVDTTEETMKSPKAAGSTKKNKVKKPNLTMDTTDEATMTRKKKGTAIGRPGYVISRTSYSDEEEVKTPEACMSSTSKSPAPKSLKPVCLIPRTPVGQAALRKYEEEFMSQLSAEKKIRKPNDTVGTTEETKKMNKKESTVVASPGLFIGTTVGCSLDKEEFNTLHACMATSQSSALKSLTPVWSIPRTPAGQAALRQYEEGLMSHESVEENTRKPYLTLGTTGETMKTKKKESTVVASPGFFISPTAELLQGVSPSAESVLSTPPNFSECNTAAVSPSADRLLEEAMAIVATNNALIQMYEAELFLSPKAGSVKTKVGEPNLNVGTVGETEKKKSEKKGTVFGVVGCLLDEKGVTTSYACKSFPKSPVPESLTTPVSLTPMTSLPLSSPKVSSTKSSTTKLSIRKSPASILNVQSTSASIPSHFFSKLEESISMQNDMDESLSTRNDKENSGMYIIHQEKTTPLADNIASVVEPIYSRKLASTPSSGDRNVVCEVNDLLFETRERRVSHNKSQERTLVPPSPKLSSPRNVGVDCPLMASAPSERKIMGSISFNSPPNSPTAQLS